MKPMAEIAVHTSVDEVDAALAHHAQAVFKALACVEDVLKTADVDKRTVSLVLVVGDRCVHIVAERCATVEVVQDLDFKDSTVTQNVTRSVA